jgi:competence protein ComEC
MESKSAATLAVVVVVASLSGCVAGVGDFAPESDDPDASGHLEVHSIDVGQADATLVVGPSGETMLIDSGHWDDDGEIVLSYLQDRGIERIDYLVTTHPHADHVGGHAAVIEYYETEAEGIGAIYDPGAVTTTATYGEYLDAVERHDVILYETQAGDEIPIEGVSAIVYNPAEDSDLEDPDASSLVIRLEHGATSFLFTGDIEAGLERRLVEAYGDDLESTVYQAGHHGSSTSSSAELLDAVDPSVAVISSDYGSEYGHPHDEPLSRLAERGIRTYWTGVHGTVRFRSDGESVTVATQSDATTDPRAIQDAEESDATVTDPVVNRSVARPSLGEPVNPQTTKQVG